MSPQITGDPWFPGDVTVKVSLVQLPIAPPCVPWAPKAAAVIARVVPATGPAMLNTLEKHFLHPHLGQFLVPTFCEFSG